MYSSPFFFVFTEKKEEAMSNTLGLLDSLGVAEDGIATVYPDTFVDDIRGAYTADADAAAAKISVLTADLAAAQAEILNLRAHNYELMTSAPVEGPAEEEETPNSEEPGDNDENSGVDSLFANKDKED